MFGRVLPVRIGRKSRIPGWRYLRFGYGSPDRDDFNCYSERTTKAGGKNDTLYRVPSVEKACKGCRARPKMRFSQVRRVDG